MQKARVAILGASGYSGEELLRLLLRHPRVAVTAVTSRQYAGQPLETVFPRFAGTDLSFVEPVVEQLAGQAEVAFLALPHGLAHEFSLPLLAKGLKVIDISADFRIRNPAVYQAAYGVAHPAPELLAEAVYGLPERYADKIAAARLIACPGCYPTSILLPSLPLLAAGLVARDGIIAASMSGVSGAGRKVELAYIFPECNESLRPYAVVGHRHVPEIEQELAIAAGAPELRISFIPHLVPVNRGIHSSLIFNAESGTDGKKALECLCAAYAGKPFVRVLGAGKLADTKHIVGTNICEIGCAYDPRLHRLIVSSAIDNLTKGAAGQAVQCLNIMLGFPETAGLEAL